MTRLLVHIGYHKTATSWLQKAIFAQPDLGFQMILDKQDVYQHLVNPPPFHFDKSQFLDVLLNELQSLKPGRQPVLSRERMVGNPHAGSFDGRMIADRLKSTVPDAKILIVVREQRSMLLSIYRQYIRGGGTLTLREYLNNEVGYSHKVCGFDWRQYQYHHLIDYYHALFGKENVLVLPYEALVKDVCGFLRAVCQYCNMSFCEELFQAHDLYSPRHLSLTPGEVMLKRRVNFLVGWDGVVTTQKPVRLSRGKYKRLGRVIKRISRMVPAGLQTRLENKDKDYIAAFAENKYDESNRCVDRLMHYNLRDYNYAGLQE